MNTQACVCVIPPLKTKSSKLMHSALNAACFPQECSTRRCILLHQYMKSHPSSLCSGYTTFHRRDVQQFTQPDPYQGMCSLFPTFAFEHDIVSELG